MLDIMFELPSRDDVEKCLITKETVLNNAEPTLVLSDLKKRSMSKIWIQNLHLKAHISEP